MRFQIQATAGERHGAGVDPWYSFSLEVTVNDGIGGEISIPENDAENMPEDRYPRLDDLIQDDPEGFADAIGEFIASKIPGRPIEGDSFTLQVALVDKQENLLSPAA